MSGTLFVVPTPIGNMGDITLRARDTLASCDFVAAEDTRVGGKLLMLLGIKKPLVSFHEHTSHERISSIVEKIENGETCALITDAGTPAVSDPGEKLVAACAERGITVIPLPGACAAITALSASGLPSRRFCFEGFLPESGVADYLASLAAESRTMIFYSAPHDLSKVVSRLGEAFGDRRCVLAKELTKLNECFVRCTLLSLPAEIESRGAPFGKGEFVIIVEGSTSADRFWTDMDVSEHIMYYVNLGQTKMDACKLVARDRGVSKSVVYKVAADMKDI